MKRTIAKSCENDKCMHLFESVMILHGRGAFAVCPDCGTHSKLAVVDVVNITDEDREINKRTVGDGNE